MSIPPASLFLFQTNRRKIQQAADPPYPFPASRCPLKAFCLRKQLGIISPIKGLWDDRADKLELNGASILVSLDFKEAYRIDKKAFFG